MSKKRPFCLVLGQNAVELCDTYQTGNGRVHFFWSKCYFHVRLEHQTLSFLFCLFTEHALFALNLFRKDACNHNCRVDNNRTLTSMKMKLTHCLKASVSYSKSKKTVVLISKSHFQIIENFVTSSNSNSTFVLNITSKFYFFFFFYFFEIDTNALYIIMLVDRAFGRKIQILLCKLF